MKRASTLILLPAMAFTLAACGGDDQAGGSASSNPVAEGSAPATGQPAAEPHNDQDVMFAQMMIPHHQQAIEMAGLAASRASAPQVKKLAADIKQAHDPEIKQMTGWLRTWGASVPSPGTTIDHSGHGGMAGMMTDQQMARLEGLSGKAFDKVFLEMMTEHHKGSVTMAKAQQSEGTFPEAKALAGTITATQTAEIATMRDLFNKM